MAEITFNRNCQLYQDDLEVISNSFLWQNLNSKKIAITGATGLIGTLIVDELIYLNDNYNAEITIFALGRNHDKLLDRFHKYLNRTDFIVQLYESSMPFPKIDIDYIVHCAGNSHPDLFSKDPVGTFLGNIKGAENVITFATEHNITALIISSGEVYGENRDSGTKMNEEYTGILNLNNSRSCYSEGKRAVESLCQSYIYQYGSKLKIARPCRIFGPTMTKADNKASAQFIKNAFLGHDIILKSKGTQQFSYIYGADAVSAILTILTKGEIGVPYNISNEMCDIALKNYAQIVGNLGGVNVVYDIVGEQGGSLVQNALLDNTKLKSLGWSPFYNINNAVDRTLKILKIDEN